MTDLVRLAAPALIALAIAATSSPAHAATDAEKQAQALFVDGMKLMGQKQYAEACEKLAKSQSLDPGMGTQYRLAECYEKLGRLASAFEQYTAVADAAKAAKKADREMVSRRRAAALEARVAKLTIVVPPSVASLPGVEVARDGVAVDKDHWGAPVPVDAGDHVVTARAPGKKPWQTKVWAEGSAKLSVSIALEDDKPPVEEKPPQKSKIPAIALGGAGGVIIIVGATFVGLRSAQINSAHKLHDSISKAGGDCVRGGSSMFADECSKLFGATSGADHLGTASIVTFIVGGAALAGMATYLLLPGPQKPAHHTTGGPSLHLSPVAGPDLRGAAAWGTF